MLLLNFETVASQLDDKLNIKETKSVSAIKILINADQTYRQYNDQQTKSIEILKMRIVLLMSISCRAYKGMSQISIRLMHGMKLIIDNRHFFITHQKASLLSGTVHL